jgi:hypothetical protein
MVDPLLRERWGGIATRAAFDGKGDRIEQLQDVVTREPRGAIDPVNPAGQLVEDGEMVDARELRIRAAARLVVNRRVFERTPLSDDGAFAHKSRLRAWETGEYGWRWVGGRSGFAVAEADRTWEGPEATYGRDGHFMARGHLDTGEFMLRGTHCTPSEMNCQWSGIDWTRSVDSWCSSRIHWCWSGMNSTRRPINCTRRGTHWSWSAINSTRRRTLCMRSGTIWLPRAIHWSRSAIDST